MFMELGLKSNPKGGKANPGKNPRRNPKDLFACTTEKDSKGMNQGTMKEGLMFKDFTDLEQANVAKESRPTRCHKQPPSVVSNALDDQLSMGRHTQLVNYHCQV